MKYYRVNFTADVGLKKERIRNFEEFVKCDDQTKIEEIILNLYGENGRVAHGKNIQFVKIEEV